MHATERRGRSVEATATETAAAVIIATLRLPNQSCARKKRDPIEFGFHDLDFLCLFVWLFLKFIISLA